MSQKPDATLLARFAAIVGEQYALTSDEDKVPFMREWRDKYQGQAVMVLCPQNTAEVSQILALANETGTSVVPQGGNTGLVGGQIPFEGGDEIVLSLSRLNKVRSVDPVGNVMVAGGGCDVGKGTRGCRGARSPVSARISLTGVLSGRR